MPSWPATEQRSRKAPAIRSSSPSSFPLTAKDEINVPIALGAFRDNPLALQATPVFVWQSAKLPESLTAHSAEL